MLVRAVPAAQLQHAVAPGHALHQRRRQGLVGAGWTDAVLLLLPAVPRQGMRSTCARVHPWALLWALAVLLRPGGSGVARQGMRGRVRVAERDSRRRGDVGRVGGLVGG
jgi:hypothetical protein